MEELSPDAGLILFPRHQLLQLSARGWHEVSFSVAVPLVLCLLKHKVVRIKIVCSHPNEREIIVRFC